MLPWLAEDKELVLGFTDGDSAVGPSSPWPQAPCVGGLAKRWLSSQHGPSWAGQGP